MLAQPIQRSPILLGYTRYNLQSQVVGQEGFLQLGADDTHWKDIEIGIIGREKSGVYPHN